MQAGRRLTAIEVKSGRTPQAHAGTAAFAEAFKVHRTLLIGGDGVRLEDFLVRPVAHWSDRERILRITSIGGEARVVHPDALCERPAR